MKIFLPVLAKFKSNRAAVCCFGATIWSKACRLRDRPDHRAFLRRLLWKRADGQHVPVSLK